MQDISALRKEYAQRTLDEGEVDESPFRQFELWFNEALKAEIPEPNAMVLATAGKDAVPFQRTVLLKQYDEHGFVFYTNYQSRKAEQIKDNPRASLLFPWYELERQVSINGRVEKVSHGESMKYFLSRPHGSQLGAWVSQQSQVISSRSILEMKLAELKRKFSEGKIPFPDFWGGFRVVPERIEFWQGRTSRLHDRIEYIHSEGHWLIRRLSP
jgi:pyridoxamine 5'-phosphate oxidase